MAGRLKLSECNTQRHAEDVPPAAAAAKPFGPAVQPIIAQANAKTPEELGQGLNKTPLFMTELPGEDGEQIMELEALKALAVDDDGTTPLEKAQDFKDQGNEFFQAKIWSNAKEQYTQAINILFLQERRRRRAEQEQRKQAQVLGIRDMVPCINDSSQSEEKQKKGAREEEEEEEIISRQRKLLETLHVNRAAAHLELNNNRSATLDCASALRLNPRNVKAHYRSSRALLAVDRIREADDACARGLELEPSSKALQALAQEIAARAKVVDARNKARAERQAREEHRDLLLRTALRARGIRTRATTTTARPADVPDDARVKLVPDEHDPTSTLCFPAVLLYPAHMQSDFVKEFRETETLADHLAYVFPLPWDKTGEYGLHSVECYMDAVSAGGVIKVGKKVSLLEILGSGKTEVMDGIVRVFVLPTAGGRAESWVREYKAKRVAETDEQRRKGGMVPNG